MSSLHVGVCENVIVLDVMCRTVQSHVCCISDCKACQVNRSTITNEANYAETGHLQQLRDIGLRSSQMLRFLSAMLNHNFVTNAKLAVGRHRVIMQCRATVLD